MLSHFRNSVNRFRIGLLIFGAWIFSAFVATRAQAAAAPTVPTSGRYKLFYPLGGLTIPQLIGAIIKFAMGVVGAVFLAVLIYGGIMWMTAGGEGERVKKARSAITNGIIGLAIVFVSYLLASLLIQLSTRFQS